MDEQDYVCSITIENNICSCVTSYDQGVGL